MGTGTASTHRGKYGLTRDNAEAQHLLCILDSALEIADSVDLGELDA